MKSIQDGKLLQLSPSLLNTFDASSPYGCERRGWFKYVKGILEPTTESMTKGTHLHAMNEVYLRTGKLLLGTAEQTAWFNAGKHYLDRIRECAGVFDGPGLPVRKFRYLVEASLPSDFRVYGIPVSSKSRCDVVITDGIIDWKTTSDIEKYGKTPGELAKDVQMLIYAQAFHSSAPAVTLAHGQYQTKGRAKFQLSSVELTRKELDTNYERVILPLVERVKSVAGENDVNNVTPNRNACRLCPHQAICPSEKESLIMSIFDRLKQSAKAEPKAEPKTEPAAILPPDAPPSKPELAAKPVEGFSPVPSPRVVVVNHPVDQSFEGWGSGVAEALAPVREGLNQNIEKIRRQLVVDAPSPSADLEHMPMKDILRSAEIEAQKIIASGAVVPPIPEPVKRGPGRPPGAKNKPKAEPSKALEAPTGVTVSEPLVPGVVNAADFIQFESVTVNYGLTLKLGDGKSYEFVRLDCSMTAKGRDPDATYSAVLEKVKANVSAEIERLRADIRAAQTLNPNGGGK